MLYHILLAVAINTKSPSDFSEGTGLVFKKLYARKNKAERYASRFFHIYRAVVVIYGIVIRAALCLNRAL